MKKAKKLKYYSLTNILKMEAQYNIVFGMRSNGKSFAAEEYGIKQYIENGSQMAIIRRYDMDLRGRKAESVFSHFVDNPSKGNLITEWTEGKWTDIYYFSGRWFFCYYNDKNERIKDAEPFCFAFSLAGMEHDKSTSYPKICTIVFDEFLTRNLYLPDEFISFTNVLSTIIRQRDDVKIFMLGNTVNKYSPYFTEMGLDNIEKMNPGDIQLYRFAVKGDTELKIAVEYADNPNEGGSPSDVYFAFNNPKLKMITNGLWELAVYPHLPYKYTKENILGTYFILWERAILQCEIIDSNDTMFTYIHRKTTPIQDDAVDLIFSVDYHPGYNYRRKLTRPMDDVGRRVKWFFDYDKVFYQDNEIGEVVRNYLQWCNTDRGFM